MVEAPSEIECLQYRIGSERLISASGSILSVPTLFVVIISTIDSPHRQMNIITTDADASINK